MSEKYFLTKRTSCEHCQGSGHHANATTGAAYCFDCEACDGRGHHEEREPLYAAEYEEARKLVDWARDLPR